MPHDHLPSDVVIASMMICYRPKTEGRRLVLSASDSVWETARVLPQTLSKLLTDDVGNANPIYGGGVQLSDAQALGEVARLGLFACFRAVQPIFADHVQTTPPTAIYSSLREEIMHLGWDVCVGNAFAPASLEAEFPTSMDGESDYSLNEWSLLDSLEGAEHYTDLNNKLTPEDAPWYPVAVCVDKRSYQRLEILLQSCT